MAAKMKKTKTPGVYKRGSRYVEVWTYRGRQYKKSHSTYAEARESKARRIGGDRRPETRKNFGEYFRTWIKTYTGRTASGLSETTREEYRRSIEALALPVWRTWRLSEIEQADIRELFSALRNEGRSTAQIRKLRTALSSLFAAAAEDGLIQSNPAYGLRIPAPVSPEPESTIRKALTEEELHLLLDAMPDEWRPFFQFLTETGLRISEAIGLQWQHLDLTGAVPEVKVREQFYRGKRRRLKTRNGRREVPLSPEMTDYLLKLRSNSYRGSKSPVFASRAGTELHAPNVRRRVLAPAAISLGFYVEVKGKDGQVRKRATIGFHTFRHTCASILFNRGRSVVMVSHFMGHADPAFTLRTYVHLMGDGVGGPLSLGNLQGSKTDFRKIIG